MSAEDIRWIQRYIHFEQAFKQLRSAVELAQQRALSDLEEQGMIQAFEYTHEMAWNVLERVRKAHYSFLPLTFCS